MDRIDRWATHVRQSDRLFRTISVEFAESAQSVADMWAALVEDPTDDAALNLLIEIKILLEIHTRIERRDLAREVARLFRLYPDSDHPD